MDSKLEKEKLKIQDEIRTEEKKEIPDMKKLITKVDNRVKTKVYNDNLGCNRYERSQL